MDFRTAYTRRLEKASRREQRLGAFAVFSVVAGVTALLAPDLMASRQESGMAIGSSLMSTPAPSSAAPTAAHNRESAARRVYPYSIIPGGVADVAELTRVISADRVVAAHYADFDVARARAVTVTKPRAVYVSYRKGDQVFWTAKKLMLAQGETLFTDGENEMRARCANRISDVPRFPVEAHGPSEAELDTVLASASGEVEGMFLATAADVNGDEGGSGSRYPLGYFPDGGGLAQPASSLASMRSSMPSVPQADRSGLYGMSTGNRVRPTKQGGSSQNDPDATPGVGSSNGGTSGSGSGGQTVQAPGGGATPATGGSDTPAGGDPSATPGTGDPATPGAGSGDAGPPATGGNGAAEVPGTGGSGDGNGNNGGGNPGNPGNPGASDQPSTPAPDTGPELPPQGPATPGAPLPPASGDTELPAAPTEVPEPGTLWLSSAAAAALLWLRRKGIRAGR